ncbi:hypothetical protein NC653_027327 [Populus alba x Populus x berolinensis]|uniref:Uncharacterized protein n=1 Tax=Populus alba x Populus x berolinensis TaxID=444605 RepID=A0AAD6M5M7_9ROSI|nr:hypothetical protein NC653_027327 [Populus alba x Populus x berolinensis]
MMVQLVLFVELKQRLLVSLLTSIFHRILTTTTFIGVHVLIWGLTGLVVLVSSCRLE